MPEHPPPLFVAVDLPSGVDADTGAVADPSAAIWAQETVTFGCLKPGFVGEPGAGLVGDLTLIDIGLDLADAGQPVVRRIEKRTRPRWFGRNDDKYTREVVGVVAGSPRIPALESCVPGQRATSVGTGHGQVRRIGTGLRHQSLARGCRRGWGTSDFLTALKPGYWSGCGHRRSRTSATYAGAGIRGSRGG